jgi:hypothetical protein
MKSNYVNERGKRRQGLAFNEPPLMSCSPFNTEALTTPSTKVKPSGRQSFDNCKSPFGKKIV